MTLGLILISILLLILILIIVVPLKIMFNSDGNFDFNIMVTWLKSSFKAIVENKDTNIFLRVYLFNKKVLDRPLRAKSKNKKKSSKHKNKIYYLKQIRPYYSDIDTCYGFEDPSTTGIIYGIINSVTKGFNLNNVSNKADFTSENNYFIINGFLKINISSTIVRLVKSYMKSHGVIYGN